MQIRGSLEPFNYDPKPDGYSKVAREKRELITLENGAEYEGEWSDNRKDGRGV
jgi:hypothetical protein